MRSITEEQWNSFIDTLCGLELYGQALGVTVDEFLLMIIEKAIADSKNADQHVTSLYKIFMSTEDKTNQRLFRNKLAVLLRESPVNTIGEIHPLETCEHARPSDADVSIEDLLDDLK
jgi:hypothetical protein